MTDVFLEKIPLTLSANSISVATNTALIKINLLTLSLSANYAMVFDISKSADVSINFLNQLNLRQSEPLRRFMIGTSDYSERVVKWPKFTHKAQEFNSVRVNVELANQDKILNHFYANIYTLPNTATLDIGFTHPRAGTEYMTQYIGFLKEVKYNSKRNCIIYLRDKLWEFTEKKIADSENPIEFSSQIPTDIIWTLCTCYGGLDDTQDSNNIDIDYDSFEILAGVFSADNVVMKARYEGEQISEAFSSLSKYLDVAIYPSRDGRVAFKRFVEPSSLDATLTPDEYSDLEIKLDGLKLVNKAYVAGQYQEQSDYWLLNVVDVATTSVNTFGVHEYTWKDKTCWYQDSVSALNLAQRKTMLLKDPPKKFNVKTGLNILHLKLGDTIRLVDSFFDVTSGSGWRMTRYDLDMQNGIINYELDEATIANAFYLDFSDLDGDDLLL